MRFAYIDSQGNEVPIPSIDALALRIELGAVGPDTQLYDAQADHWGPAHTHEIFHSLSRDVGDEGFMAPPPVAPAPPTAQAPAPQAATPKPDPEPTPKQAKEEDFDLGLTLADAPPESAVDDPQERSDFGDLGEELASAAESADLLATEESVPEPESGVFDFGDLGSGLELEPTALSADLAEPDMDLASPPAGFVGGSDSMQLEQPMSAFEPDSPPGWMEESGGDEVMDFSSLPAEEEEVGADLVAPIADSSARQRRGPKDRPSPPKFKKQRQMSGPIVFVVLLMALGVGGYVGWPILSARLAERSAPERPPVVMPAIPEELVPQMTSLGQESIAGVVSDVSEATRVAGAPTEPDDDWLAGVYLANASQYASVEAFWTSIDDFVQGLRAADRQAYRDKFADLVGQAGLAPEVAAQLTERADSGFVAAQPLRTLAYGELQRAVDASLDLHDFLIANEDDIVYRPGLTSANDPNVDPVLEISAPADARARMQQMFDDITDALDALGSLDRVTRDRLVSAMRARLQQVGME